MKKADPFKMIPVKFWAEEDAVMLAPATRVLTPACSSHDGQGLAGGLLWNVHRARPLDAQQAGASDSTRRDF